MAWSSMDGESPRSGSNQGSVAHLSEVNQESITSRGTGPQTWLQPQIKGACVAESNNHLQTGNGVVVLNLKINLKHAIKKHIQQWWKKY